MADLTQAEILPRELRSGVRGGSAVGEMAFVAWELGLPLSQFEAQPLDDREWAIATHRVRSKLDAVRIRESHDRAEAHRRKSRQ